ncbi:MULTISPECIES: hypothetical protein [unclassified Bradyrhizobium]|uniref:hypothetical protein n=1 Tax=unclassified Bradyrhizobium TaxID=2631580 RepID=UPI0024794F6E|nr:MULTISPECIES: hypothetical protein [unclassified Bradyrhizobium]WGS17662.1 hypothetical protein MTX22_23860 [Bradyrhizobium sp. ISRA463]WGS24452.1 hypothetical protein MTX19_21525 [Bradyrhizobium sp. ISRA464]
MLLRICSAVMLASLVMATSAHAQSQLPLESMQIRSLFKMPEPRDEFVRQCVPHMAGRWAHPEAVCGCLHDHAVATIEDSDLRQAVLRGISETGVPTIENDWLPPSKQAEIGPTFTKIAKPTLQCMFEPLAAN